MDLCEKSVIEKELESNMNTYKCCFVPECTNTTSKDPEKVFLSVPSNPLKRKAWSEAVGYTKNLKSMRYCCADHFDLKEDLENYYQWKFMHYPKNLKSAVVPHLNIKRDSLAIPFKELSIETNPTAELASTSYSNEDELHNIPIDLNIDSENTLESLSVPDKPITVNERPSVRHVYVEAKPGTSVKSTQTLKPKDQKVSTKNVAINCNILKMTCATKKWPGPDENLNETTDSISSITTDSSNIRNTEEMSTSTEEESLRKHIFQQNVYDNYGKIIIEDNPSHFIGVNKDSMYILDIVQKASNISMKNIYLILKKIKTNESFLTLSYQFGLSERHLGRIFNDNVQILSKYFQSLVSWPDKTDILLNLPVSFRYRYDDIQSTIDCFEIEIEKPADALHQSQSWSEYKKCNTIKYLISVSPDGLITYISEGFSGRTSDMAIVENSNYLDTLPPNTSVLADRGFKQLDVLLNRKQCKLIRPPSVHNNIKSTPEEVKLTKQIASLRIHVERVINRIRNFRLLDIHTRIDHNLISCLNYCMIISAALVNMQSGILKEN